MTTLVYLCIVLLYLVEKVDLCYCVGSFSRMFDQQGYEPHKGIEVVVTLGPDYSCTGCWVVLLLCLSPIAYLHTHFCAKPEEPRDQIICLKDSLLMHLKERKGHFSSIPGTLLTRMFG